MLHRALRPFSTRGSVSNRPYKKQPDDEFEAPVGEFDHMPPGRIEAIGPPLLATVETRPVVAPPAKFSVGPHSGGGYYVILDRRGAEVEKVRGKARAKERVSELNG